MRVPFIDLSREANFLIEELKKETEDVLKSGIYINGPKVKEFEDKFSIYCGVKYAISLGNGSDGLTFIMKALNIGKGDTVICPANSLQVHGLLSLLELNQYFVTLKRIC